MKGLNEREVREARSRTGERIDQATVPRLYLSSAGAGWDGLEAHAFLEPNELEGWMTPIIPAVSLVLFRGGGMRIEARHADGPWSAVSVHQGDLSLRAGWSPPAELRWKRIVDSGAPSATSRTLHLRVSKDLLEHTAEAVAGYDSARLSLVERAGFHDPLLTQIGLTLWCELEQPSPVGRLYAQTAAQLLAVHLLRWYTSVGAAVREPLHGRMTPQQVQRVKDFVQAHLSQDLYLDALAQQAGFSPYHFARLFRRTLGESPHQFVLRQRIERARSLLEEADVSLAQVALAAGFAHQSHLTQQFKRHLGMTPSTYRRERSIRAGFEQIRDSIA
jgi:AraC family transcriptional regulator